MSGEVLDTGQCGPLTWGQAWPWLDVSQPPQSREFESPRLRCPVPAGLGTAQARAAVRAVLGRCESLRTTVHIGADGEPYQRVRPADLVPVQLVTVPAGGNSYDTGERFIAEAVAELDITERPVAFAVLVDDDRPVEVVAVLSHVTSDGWGAGVVQEMVAAALAAVAASDPHAWGAAWSGPTPQPLADAAVQATPAGQARDTRAAAQRAEHRRRLPHTLFPQARSSGRACPASRAELTSQAVALAAELLCRRHRVSAASVYLAAYATALWAHTGFRSIGLDMSSVNRSTPARRRLVSSTVLPALAVIDVHPEERFTELLRRAGGAAMEASSYSEGDHTRRMLTDVVGCHERGVHFYCSPEFNLEQSPGAGIDPALMRPEVISQAVAATGTRAERITWFDRFRLEIRVHRGRADLQLWASESLMDPETALAVLRDVETILVRAVTDNPQLRQLAADLAGRPPERGAGWAYVDNCWVRPDALAELLGEHPDVAHSAVFLDPATGRLTAYLVPRRKFLNPGRVHRWLVTAMTRTPAVMAAHRYVVCTRAPEQPGDVAAWRRMPVLDEGDGRGPIHPPSQPRTDRQHLLLDVVRRLGTPTAELDDCYPLTGARLVRIPAILDALSAAGWSGLTVHDFASTRSLGELADRLIAPPDRAGALVATVGAAEE